MSYKITPSKILPCVAVGVILGVFISALILVVVALMADAIHDEESLFRTYDYPILGKVPNLLDVGTVSYGNYTQTRPKNK